MQQQMLYTTGDMATERARRREVQGGGDGDIRQMVDELNGAEAVRSFGGRRGGHARTLESEIGHMKVGMDGERSEMGRQRAD